ncbi:MFS transporter [Candidatus Bathyarchaeota archaeon]|nr:MFS transporter [Candidatus Bathyarchaeota archaeon]MBT4423673.1 MFS transporter [Candidatus Bathyarchaeota archaeon]MBT6604458.1 MFS transporter [Candidatus Bathyarchaeota archaeon]MBT7186538.1 MFS transporter [Candidatus Bathyarchaeota archaeon]MBT7346183.1 MFS transporter [Candidatus Bathyarchaeota archaeon]
MKGFTVIWGGQFVSLLGTFMTRFALTIWAWQVTGEATALALTGLAFALPNILLYPVAGALVDRWNRKLVMMLSDIASGIATLVIFLLFTSGNLQIWHLYVTGAFSGLFQSFQFPAYSAAVSTMVDKKDYTRTSAMLSLAQNTSGILSPVAAGVLLPAIGMNGILVFDLFSVAVAVAALLAVNIPQPEPKQVEERNSLLEDSLFGFKYIMARPGLLGLQLVFFTINFIGSLGFPLLAPMILSRTGDNSIILGTVQSAFGAGGIVGGLALSAWGGPKKRVHGVLSGMALSCLFGYVAIGLGKDMYTWAIGAFLMMLFNPLINGSNQAIWQSKVPPEMQGRVFGTRAMIALISQPVAMAITGPLADKFLIPGMMEGGVLVPYFSWLVGVGLGTGISLLWLFLGVIGFAAGLGGYLFKQVRDVESILPDHDEVQVPTH